MNRLKRYAIVTSVIENLEGSGSWCGETHIQKSIYFLEKLFPYTLDYPFILYKHGPFSFELRDDLGTMVADRFLKLVPMSPYGPKILPGDLSIKIKELFPKTLLKHEYNIIYITGKLGGKGIAELEAIATALYISTELMPSEPIERRARKLSKIKTHIPFEEAIVAMKEVDEIITDRGPS